MTSSSLSHRLLLISSMVLLTTSIGTFILTSHATSLLAQYFPAGAWYIWRGQDDTYDDQQTAQQWIAVDYSETTERLALTRAVLGTAAGILGIWTMGAKPRAAIEDDIQVIFSPATVSYLRLTSPSGPPLSLPKQNCIRRSCGICSHIIRQHTCVGHMVWNPALPVIQDMPHTNIVEPVQQQVHMYA